MTLWANQSLGWLSSSKPTIGCVKTRAVVSDLRAISVTRLDSCTDNSTSGKSETSPAPLTTTVQLTPSTMKSSSVSDIGRWLAGPTKRRCSAPGSKPKVDASLRYFAERPKQITHRQRCTRIISSPTSNSTGSRKAARPPSRLRARATFVIANWAIRRFCSSARRVNCHLAGCAVRYTWDRVNMFLLGQPPDQHRLEASPPRSSQALPSHFRPGKAAR